MIRQLIPVKLKYNTLKKLITEAEALKYSKFKD
jgi:hypothetical protein